MYSQKVFEAFEYACTKHTYQRRKGNRRVPYINHPAKVASTLASHYQYCTETLLLAALLHDVIEDTDATAEDLSVRFGEEVTGLVLEVTDDMSLPYPLRKRLQAENAPGMSDNAKLIKLADKLCNMQDILTYPLWWTRVRKSAYFQWSGEVAVHCFGICPSLDAAFRQVHQTGTQKYGRPT